MTPSKTNRPNERLLRAIEALIDGSIDAEEMSYLSDRLEQDPEAVATYADYLNLHAALRHNFRSHSDPDGTRLDLHLDEQLTRNARSKKNSTSWNQWTSYLAALAATLLVGFWMLTTSFNAPNNSATDSPIARGTDTPVQTQVASDTRIENVAVLTRLVDVEWDEGTEGAAVGEPLPRRELRIKSGLMQVEFYCGAAVIVEGPAAFELVAPDRGYTYHGKLRALVPPRARGFTIGTESGNVVDLGTEFGLDISADGPSQLHVIDGEVDFYGSADSEGEPQKLFGGQGLHVTEDGEPWQLIESDSSRFVNYDELNARASAKDDGKYQRWLEYHKQLSEDPSLVADYFFDDGEGWGRTLVNTAPNAHESSYGAIVGAGWQEGRWTQSKALRFRSPSDRVRLKIDGEFDSLTLACWLNLRELNGKRSVALLHPEIDYKRNGPDKQRFIHWTLNPTPFGAVMHFAESCGHDTGSRNHYSSVAHGLRQPDLGNWVHLAVVYDSEGRKVSHYKNGELLGSKDIEAPRKLGIGVADLCNWPYKEWAADTQFEFRNLDGLVDEFVVLERALSASEIHEMFEVGQP